MAVLGNVTVMVPIGTLVLFRTVQEGPAAVPVGTERFADTYKRGPAEALLSTQ